MATNIIAVSKNREEEAVR